jgi:hypothetical protein
MVITAFQMPAMKPATAKEKRKKYIDNNRSKSNATIITHPGKGCLRIKCYDKIG